MILLKTQDKHTQTFKQNLESDVEIFKLNSSNKNINKNLFLKLFDKMILKYFFEVQHPLLGGGEWGNADE